MLAAYWLGVAWQVGRTARSLGWLYHLSRQHPRTRLGRGWLVHLPAPSRPAFSFGRYVFLSPAHAQLSPTKHAQLVQYERRYSKAATAAPGRAFQPRQTDSVAARAGSKRLIHPHAHRH